jgi:hypothetical protein
MLITIQRLPISGIGKDKDGFVKANYFTITDLFDLRRHLGFSIFQLNGI